MSLRLADGLWVVAVAVRQGVAIGAAIGNVQDIADVGQLIAEKVWMLASSLSCSLSWMTCGLRGD